MNSHWDKIDARKQLAFNCYTAMEMQDDGPRVLAVVSPEAGDGRTATVSSLIHGFAALNMNVCVIDLNYMNSSLTDQLKVLDPMAMNELRTSKLRFLNLEGSGSRILGLLPGTLDPILLSSVNELKILFQKASEDSEIVIVDTPCAFENISSINIAEAASDVLMVSRLRYTVKAHLKSVLSSLRSRNVEPIGIVVNEYDSRIPKRLSSSLR